MNSIFGNENPQFKVGGVIVDLPHSTLQPKWIMPKLVQFDSVLTGHRSYKKERAVSEFPLFINLFECTDPIAKQNEIESYLYQLVEFYPHKDAEPLNSKFFIMKVETHELEENSGLDVCEMLFVNENYCVLPFIVLIYNYGKSYGMKYGEGL